MSAVGDAEMLAEISTMILEGSKSGWLGIVIALLASGLVGYLRFQSKRVGNSGAEETQKIRHTASSQILTDNMAKEREHARVEAAVDNFFEDETDAFSGKAVGGGNIAP